MNGKTKKYIKKIILYLALVFGDYLDYSYFYIICNGDKKQSRFLHRSKFV